MKGDRVRATGGVFRWAAALAAALLAVSGQEATAQGFGVYEQGTCAMGRAGAAVADPCDDGSAIFFNPAGLAGRTGLTLSGGGTGILALGEFTDDLTGRETDLEEKVIPVPHLYGVLGLTERLSVGVGAYAPYGLKTEWPLDFDGRFLGYDNRQATVYLQPTAAYRLNDYVSVGGGLVVAISSVELNQRLDLSEQQVPGAPDGVTFGSLGIPFHTQFADAELDASGATGVGGNFGIQLHPTEAFKVGLRYTTQITLEYDGDATFEPVSTGIILPEGNPFGVPAGTPLDAVIEASGVFGPSGALADQGVRTEITMPDQLAAGVAVSPLEGLRLMGDVVWTNWADFDSVFIQFESPATPDEVMVENYDDTFAFRAGAELDLPRNWTGRLGYAYNEAAAPEETVTPLLPEGDRNQVAAGLGWNPSQQFEVNVAYLFLVQDDRRGRTRRILPGRDLNNGLYSFRGHLFGATFTLHF